MPLYCEMYDGDVLARLCSVHSLQYPPWFCCHDALAFLLKGTCGYQFDRLPGKVISRFSTRMSLHCLHDSYFSSPCLLRSLNILPTFNPTPTIPPLPWLKYSPAPKTSIVYSEDVSE